MVPLVSCVWSCAPRTALLYPARYLFTFLDHHGALSVSGSPRVAHGRRRLAQLRRARGQGAHRHRAVDAGAQRAAGPRPASRSATTPTTSAPSTPPSSPPTPTRRSACWPIPPPRERATLGAFASSVNETVLHTDALGAAHATRARGRRGTTSSTAARRTADEVHVSYDMNRLQRLDEPRRLPRHAQRRRTRRRGHRARPDELHAPVYTADVGRRAGVAPGLNDDRLAFAGAYHGWGFHEDGCLSGVRAAAALGVEW